MTAHDSATMRAELSRSPVSRKVGVEGSRAGRVRLSVRRGTRRIQVPSDVVSGNRASRLVRPRIFGDGGDGAVVMTKSGTGSATVPSMKTITMTRLPELATMTVAELIKLLQAKRTNGGGK